MKTEIQSANSERKIKLWQLLLAIVVLGAGLALLPERIGAPIFVIVEGLLVITLLAFAAIAVFKKLTSK